MTYNAKYNEQNYKYRTDKFKRVGVDFYKEYYDNVLKPAADSQNMPVGTFIKSAVDKEINNLQLTDIPKETSDQSDTSVNYLSEEEQEKRARALVSKMDIHKIIESAKAAEAAEKSSEANDKSSEAVEGVNNTDAPTKKRRSSKKKQP